MNEVAYYEMAQNKVLEPLPKRMRCHRKRMQSMADDEVAEDEVTENEVALCKRMKLQRRRW